MDFLLKQRFRIESARYLPNLEVGHPCGSVHGHSFLITLFLKGPLEGDKGWVMDFNDIRVKAEPVLKKIDHKLLNEVPGLANPTSEILCRWIYESLKPDIALLQRVAVSETPDSETIYPA